MLAKLFDNISLTSLIRALSFALILTLGLVIFKVEAVRQFSIFGSSYLLSPVLYKVLYALVLFGTAAWLNLAVNRAGYLRNDYQLIPVFTLLLAPTLLRAASFELLVILPLGLLLVLRLMSLVIAPRYPFVLFDSGTIIGLMSLLYPEMLIFLIPTWLSIIIFGRLFMRALLMPLVGFAAVWSMFFSITYWVGDAEVTGRWLQSLYDFDFGFSGDWLQGWYRFTPLIVLLLAASYEIFQVYTKANVLKRQCFSFLLVLMVIFLMGGSLVQSYNIMWVWLSIPISIFIVNLIHYLPRNWLKDIVYLLLISFFVLSLL